MGQEITHNKIRTKIEDPRRLLIDQIDLDATIVDKKATLLESVQNLVLNVEVQNIKMQIAI